MRFVFVLLLCLAAACQSRKFRFAIAMSGSNWDFGWNFHVNTARVNLQKHLQVSPFIAMRAGDFAAAEALLSDVPRRCPALRPADLAALKLLARNAAARTNLSL